MVGRKSGGTRASEIRRNQESQSVKLQAGLVVGLQLRVVSSKWEYWLSAESGWNMKPARMTSRDVVGVVRERIEILHGEVLSK